MVVNPEAILVGVIVGIIISAAIICGIVVKQKLASWAELRSQQSVTHWEKVYPLLVNIQVDPKLVEKAQSEFRMFMSCILGLSIRSPRSAAYIMMLNMRHPDPAVAKVFIDIVIGHDDWSACRNSNFVEFLLMEMLGGYSVLDKSIRVDFAQACYIIVSQSLIYSIDNKQVVVKYVDELFDMFDYFLGNNFTHLELQDESFSNNDLSLHVAEMLRTFKAH